jgi:hypothetical protein
MTEREHARASAKPQPANHTDDIVRISRHASTLRAPAHPIASGLLERIPG